MPFGVLYNFAPCGDKQSSGVIAGNPFAIIGTDALGNKEIFEIHPVPAGESAVGAEPEVSRLILINRQSHGINQTVINIDIVMDNYLCPGTYKTKNNK
jgi:hypothetical protein